MFFASPSCATSSAKRLSFHRLHVLTASWQDEGENLLYMGMRNMLKQGDHHLCMVPLRMVQGTTL